MKKLLSIITLLVLPQVYVAAQERVEIFNEIVNDESSVFKNGRVPKPEVWAYAMQFPYSRIVTSKNDTLVCAVNISWGELNSLEEHGTVILKVEDQHVYNGPLPDKKNAVSFKKIKGLRNHMRYKVSAELKYSYNDYTYNRETNMSVRKPELNHKIRITAYVDFYPSGVKPSSVSYKVKYLKYPEFGRNKSAKKISKEMRKSQDQDRLNEIRKKRHEKYFKPVYDEAEKQDTKVIGHRVCSEW